MLIQILKPGVGDFGVLQIQSLQPFRPVRITCSIDPDKVGHPLITKIRITEVHRIQIIHPVTEKKMRLDQFPQVVKVFLPHAPVKFQFCDLPTSLWVAGLVIVPFMKAMEAI